MENVDDLISELEDFHYILGLVIHRFKDRKNIDNAFKEAIAYIVTKYLDKKNSILE